MKADHVPMNRHSLVTELWHAKVQIGAACVVAAAVLSLACGAYQEGFAEALALTPEDLSFRPFQPWSSGPLGLSLMLGAIAVVAVTTIAALIEVRRTRDMPARQSAIRLGLWLPAAAALTFWQPSEGLFAPAYALLALSLIEVTVNLGRLVGCFARWLSGWIECRSKDRAWSEALLRPVSGAAGLALVGMFIASLHPLLNDAGRHDGSRALASGFQADSSVAQWLLGNRPPLVVVRWIGTGQSPLSAETQMARYLGTNDGTTSVVDLGDCTVRRLPSGDLVIITRTGKRLTASIASAPQPNSCET